MPHVPVAAAAINAGVQGIRPTAEDVHQVIDFVRPGIVGFERESPDIAPELHLQRVVIRGQRVVIEVFVGKAGELAGKRDRVGGIGVGSGKADASLHVLSFVSRVIYGQNCVSRHFLLNTKQPVRGIRIFRVLREGVHVLCPCRQRRVG